MSRDVPLVQKLGLKAGARFLVGGDAPDGFLAGLAPLPEGVRPGRWPGDHAHGPADVLVCFARTAAALTAELIPLSAAITPNGALWIAWPKKSARQPTDLTEDVIRALVLPIGLVDTKVCAIDGTWSGLRLNWRKGNRPK